MSMTIAALAREAAVGVETIRYYQRRGLLGTPERPDVTGGKGGIRRYGDDDLRRLRFIRAAQAAGFTLAVVAELLALDVAEDRARARALAREQIATLEARIAALSGARDALERLAAECGAGGTGPCPILAAFDAA